MVYYLASMLMANLLMVSLKYVSLRIVIDDFKPTYIYSKYILYLSYFLQICVYVRF